MREIIIIEKSEIMGLSALIAEEIIGYSERFYGFRMISIDTKKEMGRDEMLMSLLPGIERGFMKGMESKE